MQRPKFIRPGATDDLYTKNTASLPLSDRETANTERLSEDSHTTFVYNRNNHLPVEVQRQRLPVFQYRNHILYLLEKYQTLVLVGETGSGKSTQVPQYLAETGHVVCVTQPRAAAAAALASRVALERDGGVGCAAGASVRREHTDKIVLMTEGVLLREIMASPLLTQYSCIMLDEVHERTIHTDILLGLIKKIAKKRRKLKVVISSATMDAEHMRRFLDCGGGTSVILTVQGRCHPIDIYYMQEPVADYVQATIDTIVKIHEKKPFGDVLAFLTSQEEITHVVEQLERYASSSETKYKMKPLPMYGSLPHHRQLRVFQMADKDERKVVVATDIAETSVTIPGVMYVIDCGYHKLPHYSRALCSSILSVRIESVTNATQRAGRAGRTARGECYRLFTEEAFDKMPASVPPEMERGELSSALLQLYAMDINNVLQFPFPAHPPAAHLLDAVSSLLALGALADCSLTALGRRMAELPLAAAPAALLCNSGEFGCLEEALSIAAMLYAENVFSDASAAAALARRNNFEVAEGDLMTYLNIYTSYGEVGGTDRHGDKLRRAWCQKQHVNHRVMEKVSQVRSSLEKLVKNKFQITNKAGLTDSRTERVLKCITSAFFQNAARLTPRGYETLRRDVPLEIASNSCLHGQRPQWVVYVCAEWSKGRLYMRDVSSVERDWLLELAPHYYKT